MAWKNVHLICLASLDKPETIAFPSIPVVDAIFYGELNMKYFIDPNIPPRENAPATNAAHPPKTAGWKI